MPALALILPSLLPVPLDRMAPPPAATADADPTLLADVDVHGKHELIAHLQSHDVHHNVRQLRHWGAAAATALAGGRIWLRCWPSLSSSVLPVVRPLPPSADVHQRCQRQPQRVGTVWRAWRSGRSAEQQCGCRLAP